MPIIGCLLKGDILRGVFYMGFLKMVCIIEGVYYRGCLFERVTILEVLPPRAKAARLIGVSITGVFIDGCVCHKGVSILGVLQWRRRG